MSGRSIARSIRWVCSFQYGNMAYGKMENKMVNVELNKQAKLSPHLASPSEAALGHSSELDGSRLSPHFSLGELCKTSVNTLDGNIPSREDIENLKRLCPWLEELRLRYNERYVVSPPESGGDGGGLNKRSFRPPLAPPNLGGEEEPIIITSGFRSPEVNKCVGGAYSSNHLTGCAVDIRCVGVEQAIRYAAILLDTADEWKQDYDELLIERNRHGRYWVHFAVRPKDNRRRTMFIQA